ncbi:MAG: peptide ABC transporter substrate-binding protein [Cardiobacteriaceae bacterium]|nr:peptide ABC transporter substrate-binding protein [Cardiobacteriaceae bacterium]
MKTPLLTALCIALAANAHADSIFRRGHIGEPASIDPQRAGNDGSGSLVIFDLFEGLATYAMNGDIVPGVAEKWDISADGLTYTFHLRENAQWTDGQPVTAADFVYAWQRAVDPQTASHHASLLYPVKNAEKIAKGEEKDPAALGIRALDSHTLEVSLESPTPYFIEIVALYPALPVPKHIVEAHGDAWTEPAHFASNGAYRFTGWQRHAHLTTEKSPTYWDAQNVNIDKVIYHFSDNTSSALKRYRADELDYIDVFPLDQIDWVRQNLPAELHISPYLGTYYYGFNLDLPPFKDNPELREALTLAVDRQTLIDKVAKAGQEAAYAFVPPATKNHQPYRPAWASEPRDAQIARARELYAKAGYSKDNPLKISLAYNTSESHKQIAVAVSAMWKQTLGVETELDNQEWKVLIAKLGAGSLPLFRYAATANYNDPYYFLEGFQSASPLNHVRFKDDRYDQLVTRAATTLDLEQRAQILHDAEKTLMDTYPLVPLYHYASAIMLKPHIKGYQPNPVKFMPSKYLSIAP